MHIWVAVLLVVVVGLGVHLWQRNTINNEQMKKTGGPTDKEFSQPVPKVDPAAKLDASQKDPTASPGSTVKNGGKDAPKQTDVIGKWEFFLQDKPDQAAIQKFLDSLTVEELMDLMEYLCIIDELGFVQGVLLGHLKSRWGQDIPYPLLLELTTDKERETLFRKVLADIICSSRDITTLADRDLIASHLIPIATDRTEDQDLRKIVIMKLSSVLRIGVSEAEQYSDIFLDLLQDTTESSSVRGASVTALRRMEDNRAVPILLDKSLNYTDEEDPSFARHAVVALAKYAKEEAIDSPADAIGAVIKSTQNDRVYGSAVYSLSLLDDTDFLRLLPDVLTSLQNHSNPAAQISVESALAKHKDAILEALDHDDTTYIVAGITASTMVSMPQAKEKLQELSDKFPELNNAISQALTKANL